MCSKKKTLSFAVLLGVVLLVCVCSAAKIPEGAHLPPKPASDYLPKQNGTLFSEYLCVDDPFTFTCKWIGSFGDIVDSATRPGSNYLQVAGTTGLDAYYHQVGTEIIRKTCVNMDPTVFATLALNARVGLFTFEDKTTIFPEYEHLADTPECAGRCDGNCAITCTSDGRKYDDLAGVGGVRATCVDDNFMCLPSDPYYNTFSVLVHEWGHTVHSYGLSLYWYNEVKAAYDNAYYYGIWDRTSYTMSNEFEYFAEGVGVYFYTSFIGGSQSGGMNSCGGAPGSCASENDARYWLWSQDIQLYTVLYYVFSNGQDVSGGLSVCP